MADKLDMVTVPKKHLWSARLRGASSNLVKYQSDCDVIKDRPAPGILRGCSSSVHFNIGKSAMLRTGCQTTVHRLVYQFSVLNFDLPYYCFVNSIAIVNVCCLLLLCLKALKCVST